MRKVGVLERAEDASQWTWEGPQRGPESEPLPDEGGPILGETWEIISSTPEIDQVFERFARQLGTLIEFDRIAINVTTRRGRSDDPGRGDIGGAHGLR